MHLCDLDIDFLREFGMMLGMKVQTSYISPIINFEPMIEAYLAPFRAEITDLRRQVHVLSGQVESESIDYEIRSPPFF